MLFMVLEFLSLILDTKSMKVFLSLEKFYLLKLQAHAVAFTNFHTFCLQLGESHYECEPFQLWRDYLLSVQLYIL